MNTRRLGQNAADTLGYQRLPDWDMRDRYRPGQVFGVKPPTKDQRHPEVDATKESVTITDRNYAVTFYLYFSKTGFMIFNGISVAGWPDNDKIERVLDTWNIPKLREEYNSKINWLSENPGFKKTLVPKAPQKKLYPSDIG